MVFSLLSMKSPIFSTPFDERMVFVEIEDVVTENVFPCDDVSMPSPKVKGQRLEVVEIKDFIDKSKTSAIIAFPWGVTNLLLLHVYPFYALRATNNRR